MKSKNVPSAVVRNVVETLWHGFEAAHPVLGSARNCNMVHHAPFVVQ